MMQIPTEVYEKFEGDVDIAAILSLGIEANLIDSKALENLNQSLETTLRILKIKLLLIREKKSEFCDFDVSKLLAKFSKASEENIHNLLFLALLIQRSKIQLEELINKSYANLKMFQRDSASVLRDLEIVDVVIEVSRVMDYYFQIIEEEDFAQFLIDLLNNVERQAQKKIVLDLIPKYVEYTGDEAIFQQLWENFQDDLVMYDLMITGLEKYFFPKIYLPERFSVLKQTKFWYKLQVNICSKEPSLKRRNVYILNEAITTVLSNESYVKEFSSESSDLDLVKWKQSDTDEYKKAWRSFFILCEAVSEKTLHLVEPTVKLYATLRPLHESWRKLITHLFFQHSHTAVLEIAVSNALDGSWKCDLEALAVALNNVFLYDKDGNSILCKLCMFILDLDNVEELVAVVEATRPSPVPFYFICQALHFVVLKSGRLKPIFQLLNVAKDLPNINLRMGSKLLILETFLRIPFPLDITKDVNVVTKMMNILHDCFDAASASAYSRLLKKWLAKNKLLVQQLVSLISKVNLKNLEIRTLRGWAIFVAMSSQIHASNWPLENIFNKEFFRRADSCSSDEQYKHFVFLSYAVRMLELPCLGRCSEEEFVTATAMNIFTLCHNRDPHERDSEFMENMSMMIGNFNALRVPLSRVNIVGNIIHKLAHTKNTVCCLSLSVPLLECYPAYLDCTGNVTYFLHQLQAIETNLMMAKHQLETDPTPQHFTKHMLLTKFYEAMTIVRQRQVEVDKSARRRIKVMDELCEFLEWGDSDIVLRVFSCLEVLVREEWTMTDRLKMALIKLTSDCMNAIPELEKNKIYYATISKFIKILVMPAMSSCTELQSIATLFFTFVFDRQEIPSLYRMQIIAGLHKDCPTDYLFQALLYGRIKRKDKRQ